MPLAISYKGFGYIEEKTDCYENFIAAEYLYKRINK